LKNIEETVRNPESNIPKMLLAAKMHRRQLEDAAIQTRQRVDWHKGDET